MEMHQIRYFLAAVRERNFTRAAETCQVAQPSLTRAIRRLEEEIGGTLFDRNPGQVQLTDLGRAMLPHLEQAHTAVRNALANASLIRDSRKRRLRVGLMCTLGPDNLAELLVKLAERIPDLELIIEEGKSMNIVEQLIADQFDVVIASLAQLPDEIAVLKLYSERYTVAFGPDHRFQAMSVIPLDEIVGEDYLERRNCEFDDYYATQFGDRPLSVNVRYSSEREDWIQAMVKAGMGITILPEFLPRPAGVSARLIVDPPMARDVSILTVRGRPFNSVTKAFVRLASTMKWGRFPGGLDDELEAG